MKKCVIVIALLLSGIGANAQSISHIEATGSWYYVYDQDGKKTNTLSSSIGELQGFCSSFFIVKSGSWYYIYNAKGKKTQTLSVASVGKILSVSGDTFTSQSGSWIYTWNKEGKKIGTRAAQR
ncbi:MAG: SLAP domain-containing protein [Prevotellaceae bacterium]|nr:SLAP domain-containing protein [Prevotellaceae bacterium]